MNKNIKPVAKFVFAFFLFSVMYKLFIKGIKKINVNLAEKE